MVLGDVVRLAAGDQIVADGDVLVSRDLEVDESLLTGESVPIQKEVRARLLSGSFVVAGSGAFVTTAVGSDAYAQRIAGEGKRYVRLHSDLVAGINGFLRVIGIGILPVAALMIWAQFRMDATVEHGVTNTVAALVAMIPQGLVLMTSIAFAVAAVTLAKRKVLTRELPAVEGLARVDVLCIDKTGTITEPQPAFERIELLGEPGPGGAARRAARRQRRGSARRPGQWRGVGWRRPRPGRPRPRGARPAGARSHGGLGLPRQLHPQRHRGGHPRSAGLDHGGLGALLVGPQVERGAPGRPRLLGAGSAGDRCGGRPSGRRPGSRAGGHSRR